MSHHHDHLVRANPPRFEDCRAPEIPVPSITSTRYPHQVHLPQRNLILMTWTSAINESLSLRRVFYRLETHDCVGYHGHHDVSDNWSSIASDALSHDVVSILLPAVARSASALSLTTRRRSIHVIQHQTPRALRIRGHGSYSLPPDPPPPPPGCALG